MTNSTDLIRNLRVLRGYSQSYMARRLGISQQSFSKMERRESVITIERMKVIAQILEVDVSQFFHSTELQTKQEISERVELLEAELEKVKSQLEMLTLQQ